ncbi:hypothetical protein CUMW_084290 [Citrus unshiu]|nr:hypothetical protein CUMW_084290 [Citrus unshiu]
MSRKIRRLILGRKILALVSAARADPTGALLWLAFDLAKLADWKADPSASFSGDAGSGYPLQRWQ